MIHAHMQVHLEKVKFVYKGHRVWVKVGIKRESMIVGVLPSTENVMLFYLRFHHTALVYTSSDIWVNYIIVL